VAVEDASVGFEGGVGARPRLSRPDTLDHQRTVSNRAATAAESAWGEILSARPRDSYVLATKVWGQMSDDPDDRGLSGAQILRQIDASLARSPADRPRRPLPSAPLDPERADRGDDRGAAAGRRLGKARYLGFKRVAPGADSRPRSTSPVRICSSRRSRSYSMLWRAPEVELFRSARPTGSPRSSGRRSPRGSHREVRAGQPLPSDSRAASADMALP